jgi:hypothetical protein
MVPRYWSSNLSRYGYAPYYFGYTLQGVQRSVKSLELANESEHLDVHLQHNRNCHDGFLRRHCDLAYEINLWTYRYFHTHG